LGEIGTEEAARALDALQAPAALTRTLARAKIAAANRLAAAGQTEAAAGAYQALLQPQQPEAIRVAALKGLLGTLPPAEAVKRFVEVIQGDDEALRTAALAAYVGSSNRQLKDSVAAALPAMKPAGQRVLLGILAGEADVAARPAVLQVIESSEVDVRVAALECLALHGEAADVTLVVKLAQAEPAAVAEAARRVLPRMGKPGVNEALVRMIESGQAGDRAVVLAALAARRVESALPTLARLVGDADATLATEAARALGVLGTSGQLDALAAVLIRTDNAELRGAAAEAVKSICSRAEDKPAAAKPLLAALSQAPTPAARIAMLQQLVYTRGDEALNAVRQATQDADAAVAEAAVRALIAWPEASAAPSLIELAKTTDKASFAVLALRDGCLRLANQKDLPLAQRLGIYRSVLEAAKRAEEKRQAIAGLADLPALGALELLQTAARDAELKNDATTATIRLARQLGAVYNQQALAALEGIKAHSDSDDVKRQADEAIKAVRNAGQSPEGFVVAWLLSGPYTQPGKGASELFDTVLAPEKSDGDAEWRPVTVPPGGKAGLVEMDKIFGGNDRVAYLKTQLASAKEQDAVLELGSDDGIKVWLNGQVVHANNATRPCTPGQDKVNVKLKQGANTLMLKITQGGGEWSACCRVCAPDGKTLDVTVAPNGP
jgi:HEAT repeat protein